MRMLAIGLAAAALGCAASRPAPDRAGGPAAQAPVPDTALGLAKGSVFDVPVPPPVPANVTGPGAGPLVPRAYPGAPPVIPHAIGDFLPITARENSCLDCHGVKEKKPGEATPIPPSHYLDLRRAPDRAGDTVAGTRLVCTACHVERTGAPPLVGNSFRP